MVVSILMVVLLPAPFGPKRPKIWPYGMRMSMWSTAVIIPETSGGGCRFNGVSFRGLQATLSGIHRVQASLPTRNDAMN